MKPARSRPSSIRACQNITPPSPSAGAHSIAATRGVNAPSSTAVARTGSAAAVVVTVVRGREALERRADAAAVAAPRVHALLDRDGRDQQSDDRVEPPGARDRVGREADEQ